MRKTRAAFVSCGGDPFIASMVVKLFRERWYDEVDSLYICYNNSCEIPKDTQAIFLSTLLDDPKIKVVYWPTQIGYGLPINKMLGVSTEELILLLEDDGFIFTTGVVDKCFKQIEEGVVDALGSPRFSCGTEISEALKRKYNLDYSGFGDVGPNFWPNFFFCKKKDLLETDQNFAPKDFQKGFYYPELDHTMENTESGDTFVWADIQMQHNGVQFGNVPQFHADPYEVENKEKKDMNWKEGEPWWIHGGSLSTSWGHYLKDKKPDMSSEISIREMETRIAFWWLCSDICNLVTSMDFRVAYQEALGTLMAESGFDSKRIQDKYDLYKNLMKL